MDQLKRCLLKHGLVFSALAALPGGLSAAPGKTEQQVITDIRGRRIDCSVVPQRIYVADASLMFLYASLAGKQLTEKLAAIPAAFRHADELSYQQYCRAFPALAALPHLSPLAGAQANSETIVDLHPDIIFVTTGTFSAMETGGITALLERAGIQIAVLDLSISPLKNTPRSIAIMGGILGVPDRAAKIIAFIHSHLSVVTSRLAAAPYRPVPVLLERAAGFSAECCYAYGNGNLAEFLTCAGGKNIGAEYIHGTYGTINQETIIHTRPEKVIVTGGQWQSYNPGGDWVGLGPGADLAVAEKQLAILMQRPAFKTLAAVQQRECYAIWHAFYDSPFGFIAVLKFATWLHPVLFADIDADAVFRAFYRQFLPVPWQPGYWVSLHPES
ncbi:ABC transporter substrate-binding protein [Morganella morganii]|uniref:ABC transporter substrate-binding protein n=1 Tax=Morganella morganii TaxID=582 RepID=UPI002362E4ED|nr:ABC transporter substrate-binding protein [Morganella morganii]